MTVFASMADPVRIRRGAVVLLAAGALAVLMRPVFATDLSEGRRGRARSE